MLLGQAEAEAELANAKEALEKYRQKMAAASTDGQQPGAAGKKLLRKRSAVESASRDASEQAEDSDDSLARLQQDRSAKRRKSKVPSAIVLAQHPSKFYTSYRVSNSWMTKSCNGQF